MQSRPMNVMILLALALTGGILSFIAGWWLMLGGALLSVAGAEHGTTTVVLGSLTYAVGVTSFLVAYGFWRVKPWAWGAAFVVLGVGVTVEVASVVLAGNGLLDIAVTMGLAAVTMWYLVQPRTRLVFVR
jgi:hypothetical protein